MLVKQLFKAYIVNLEQLPERSSAFGFMGLEQKNPVFQNNRVEVTKETARKMGELCEILKQRGQKKGFSTLADGRGLGGSPHERLVQERDVS